MTPNLKACQTDQELSQVADLANEIWHEYFPSIISIEQIDYMVKKFQSFEAMKQSALQYYQVLDNGKLVGYVGLGFEPEEVFISKLYLKKTTRAQGLATKVFEQIKQLAKGKASLYLTCNKYNEHSLAVYQHWGFKIVDSVETDIGSGYVMDDYILRFTLG